jgi:hypothetical protein
MSHLNAAIRRQTKAGAAKAFLILALLLSLCSLMATAASAATPPAKGAVAPPAT